MALASVSDPFFVENPLDHQIETAFAVGQPVSQALRRQINRIQSFVAGLRYHTSHFVATEPLPHLHHLP